MNRQADGPEWCMDLWRCFNHINLKDHPMIMRIDAHVHMWERRCLPDRAVQLYLEPLKKLAELGLDQVFDFRLDEEYPFPDYDEPMYTYTDAMDSNGFDYAVVLGTDFGLVNEGRMSNDDYMEWLFNRCSSDERFIPFIGIDPNRKDASEMLERYFRRYEPKGIKMYPATGFYPDDERYDGFWDKVQDMGLIVTTHAGMALAPLDERYCHPSMMRRVAETHPDTTFIIAHLGGKFYDELFPLMDACDNVCTDCSALQGWAPEDVSMILRRISEVMHRYPQRVVFGTDTPLYEFHFSTSRFVDMIEHGDWGDDRMKADLMGDNMARILGL